MSKTANPARGNLQLSENASVHLDMVRGLAAFAVMVSHVRGLFFLDYSELAGKSVFLTALYGATGLGHQAVIVFFVLSGFFIGTAVFRSHEQGRWSWKVFLVNRITRLQLVLLPALLLCALWDQVGMRVLQSGTYYFQNVPHLLPVSVASRETLSIFFGNLFFLQSFLFPSFGSNGPLWSLSYEFWYYMLFPLVMFAVVRGIRPGTRLLFAAAAVVLFLFIGPVLSLYFLIWLAGVAVGLAPRQSGLQRGRAVLLWGLLTATVFVLALAASRVRLVPEGVPSDFLVGAGFALWLYVLVHVPQSRLSVAYVKSARTLAGFSYTLYLTHFPLLLLLRASLGGAKWQPDLLHLAYSVVICAVPAGFAYAVASVTEARTDVARRKVLDILSLRRKAVAV